MSISEQIILSETTPEDRSMAIREALRNAIIDRRLAPGTKLSEAEVGSLFDVSRTVARAALQMLTFEGLVKTERNRGAFVSNPSPDEARQIFASRRLIEPGIVAAALERITLEDIEHFAHFTGDTFYAHMDEEATKGHPFFPGRVAHGYLLLSFAAGLFVDPDPGPVLANYGLDSLRFVKPVQPGEAIKVRLTAKEKSPRNRQYGEVRWDVEITTATGDTAATYELLTMNAMRT